MRPYVVDISRLSPDRLQAVLYNLVENYENKGWYLEQIIPTKTYQPPNDYGHGQEWTCLVLLFKPSARAGDFPKFKEMAPIDKTAFEGIFKR